jgi:hypothetical protein
MLDRSWEHGVHRGCAVTQRHQTLARITYQQFFRRYYHLCGMTGTAQEAADELCAVYGLQVSVPTNRRLRRTDAGTRIFGDSPTQMGGHRRIGEGHLGARPGRADRHTLGRRIGACRGIVDEGKTLSSDPQRAKRSPPGRNRSLRWEAARPTWPVAAPISSCTQR